MKSIEKSIMPQLDEELEVGYLVYFRRNNGNKNFYFLLQIKAGRLF